VPGNQDAGGFRWMITGVTAISRLQPRNLR
jgi:hypothetical protein